MISKNETATATVVTSPRKESDSASTPVHFAGRTQSGHSYRPLLVLGQGGMAELHLASASGPSGFTKLVVLKTMRKELARDPDMRDMFLGEARLSARLNHANVVQVYEVVDTAQPCMVMEYLDGQAMSTVLSKAGRSFTGAMQLRVISELLAGLHYSHELRDFDGTPLGIVHRDVSPQNVFITYDGQVKVLDFGIAKMANDPQRTRTGIIKGKIAYMAPEQLLGEASDRRTDIYAVGCMVWRAATGHKLWEGADERSVIRSLLEGRIPAPGTVKKSVDPKLEAIALKALAPTPSQRYSTALEMQAAIDEYLHLSGHNFSMRELGAFVTELYAHERELRSDAIHSILSAPSAERPATSGESDEASKSVEQELRVQADRHRRLAWIVGVGLVGVGVLLLFGVGAAYLALQGQETTLGAESSASVGSEQTPSVHRVRIAVSPREAQIFVDGKEVAGNPATLEVPADSLAHQVKATLDGHDTVVRSVRFDADLDLEFDLRSAPPSAAEMTSAAPPRVAPDSESPVREDKKPKQDKPKRPSIGKKGPPTEVGTPPLDESTGECDPPFFYDQGIKVYKPGCI